MKILILGIGKYWEFFLPKKLCLENEVAIYDTDKKQIKVFYECKKEF